MTDNFYYNCPAKTYSRITDYRLNSDIEQINMIKYGIKTPEEYREFLQLRGEEVVPKNNFKYWNTEKVHDYPTRQNPLTFYPEMKKANENQHTIFEKFYK